MQKGASVAPGDPFPRVGKRLSRCSGRFLQLLLPHHLFSLPDRLNTKPDGKSKSKSRERSGSRTSTVPWAVGTCPGSTSKPTMTSAPRAVPLDWSPPGTDRVALRFPSPMTSSQSSISESGVRRRDTGETKERTYFFLLKNY